MATDAEIHFPETCGRVVLKFLMNATTGSHCFFLFFPLIGGWGVFSVLQCSSWMEDFTPCLHNPIYACDLLVLFPEIQTNGYASFMLD
jgi:hypothetical protein